MTVFSFLFRFIRSMIRKDTNRYLRSRKKSVHQEPRLDSMGSLNKENDMMNNDSDTILGLRKEPILNKKDDNTLSMRSKKNHHIIALYVTATNTHLYGGYELLQSLLACGLRYGKMNIFHRHEYKTGRGSILFSIASIVEPGTFDLPRMGGFTCPGLILFLILNEVDDPMKAFDIMLETAGQLIEDLGGKVLDDEKKILTKEKVIELRCRIREFEEKRKIRDLFSEV